MNWTISRRAARLIGAGAAVLAMSVAAGGAAGVASNGPIFFVGARAENFYSEIYSVAADGSERTDLSRNPGADEWPAVSPRGDQIAFFSERDGRGALYLADADGRNERKLADGFVEVRYGVTRPVWAPTGRTLAVIERDLTSAGWCNPSSLYAVDIASGRRRELVRGSVDDASFSLDGRFVLYQWGACREMRGGFAVTRVIRPARSTFAGPGYQASWSPRARRLLFVRRSRKPRLDRNLVTVDPYGRRPWALVGVRANAPAWSPDGQAIAFFKPVGRRAGLYVVRPRHSPPRRLAAATGALVVWSPDGAWLAFATEGGTYMVGSTGQGLTRLGNAGSVPRWSHDSRHVAFVERGGVARVASPPTGPAVPVTSARLDGEVGEVGWTRGNRLVFASRRPTATGVFAVEPDGTNVRQLTPDGAPTGELSPDGSRLAFVRDGHVWTVRLDGGDERLLTSGADKDAEPAWSPDGGRLAFVRAGNIFVVDASGGASEQITHLSNDGFTAGPAWSPDGAWIAFTAGGLFAVRPDGSELHRIVSTSGVAAGLDPAWSPDGTKLALGGFAIAVVNVDGTGYRPLTWPERSRTGQPAWSPDGTKIVFVRSSDARFSTDSDLWTINLDGSGETRLTDGPWPDVLPAWMPVRP